MATEKRLIDANALPYSKMVMSYDEEWCLKVSEIENAPTIDAVPVVHARWIVNVEFNNGERVIATCSNCKVRGEVRTDRSEWGIWHIDSPYCPNCGAKMDGDGNGS